VVGHCAKNCLELGHAGRALQQQLGVRAVGCVEGHSSTGPHLEGLEVPILTIQQLHRCPSYGGVSSVCIRDGEGGVGERDGSSILGEGGGVGAFGRAVREGQCDVSRVSSVKTNLRNLIIDQLD